MNTEEVSKKLSIYKQPHETQEEFELRLEWWLAKWKRQNLLEDDE